MDKSYIKTIVKNSWPGIKNNREDYFLSVTIILSFLFIFIDTVTNFLIGLHEAETSWSGALTILMLLILVLIHQKRKKLRNIGKISYFLTVIISLNAMWILSGGSYSPSPVLFVAFMVLVIYLKPWPGTTISSLVIGGNIIILLLIEWQYPEIVRSYESDQNRILDYAVVITFLFSAVIPFLAFAHKNIISEKDEAKKDNQNKSAFLANMSHEIRTPMNAMVGFTELLEDENIKKDEQEAYIRIIRQNSELLLRLINNILDLSKLDARLVEANPSKFCISSLLVQVYNAHITQAKKAGIFLEPDLPGDLENAVIETDRTLLFQVFSNLITNALKVTYEGEVRFGIRQKNERLSFFVFDTGPGIPRNKQHVIFERFSQLSDHHLKNMNTDGVGLGLSICKAIVDLLGGDIRLHSEVNKGSTFIFSFPVSILKHHNHNCLGIKELDIMSVETSYQ